MAKYVFNYLKGYLDDEHEVVSLSMKADNIEDVKKEALKLHQELNWADVFSVYSEEESKVVLTEEGL